MIINKSIFYAFINICFLSLCEKALRFILIIFLKYICTQLKKKLVCSSCPRKVVLSKCCLFMNLKSIVNIFWQRLIAGKMIHTSSFLRWCGLKWLFNECICLLVSRKTIWNLNLTVFWHLKKIIYYAFLWMKLYR